MLSHMKECVALAGRPILGRLASKSQLPTTRGGLLRSSGDQRAGTFCFRGTSRSFSPTRTFSPPLLCGLSFAVGPCFLSLPFTLVMSDTDIAVFLPGDNVGPYFADLTPIDACKRELATVFANFAQVAMPTSRAPDSQCTVLTERMVAPGNRSADPRQGHSELAARVVLSHGRRLHQRGGSVRVSGMHRLPASLHQMPKPDIPQACEGWQVSPCADGKAYYG